MGTHNGVGRAVQSPTLGVWLCLEHIQRGTANITLVQSIRQRVLVNACAAAHVDDPGVVGQERQTLLVERVLGGIGAGEDHDESVSLREDGLEVVFGVDFDAVADATRAGNAFDICAESDEPGCEALGDVAEAPDDDVGALQGGELALGSVGLRAAQVTGPLALELRVAHLVEAAGGVEQQTECVLGNCVVVQAGAGGDCDLGRIEAGREDVVGARGQTLDPAQLGEALGGVFQVGGRVGPCDEDLSVGVLLRDGLLDIIRDEIHAVALEKRGIKGQRCGVEELGHLEGGWGRGSVEGFTGDVSRDLAESMH